MFKNKDQEKESPEKLMKKKIKIPLSFNFLNKIKVNQYWFKARNSIIKKTNPGIGILPLSWEGWVTHIVFFLLTLFSLFYFDVIHFTTSKFMGFFLSLIFLILLFILISKNTTAYKPKFSQQIPQNL